MKIKKIINLLSLLILITGCTAEYNINISGTEITENVNIYINKNDQEDIKSLDYYLNNNIKAYNINLNDYYYETKALANKSGMNMTYKYGEINNYALSSFFNECFLKSSISSDDEKIYIKASQFTCKSYNYVSVENAVINLTTNNYVIEHNASKVSNDTYTWYPLKNGEIDIVLKINDDIKLPIISDPDENDNNDKSDSKQKKETPAFIIILSFISFGGILLILILFKIKKGQRG